MKYQTLIREDQLKPFPNHSKGNKKSKSEKEELRCQSEKEEQKSESKKKDSEPHESLEPQNFLETQQNSTKTLLKSSLNLPVQTPYISSNRIQEELNIFHLSKKAKHLKIKFKPEGNAYHWLISLNPLKFKLTPNLLKDFQSLKLKRDKESVLLSLEILFPFTFPCQPPFFRIIKPVFSISPK